MGTLEIQVGGTYTNVKEVLAREVLAITGGSVAYRDFMLSDGAPLSPGSRCSLDHFRKWSWRELTPEEASRLQKDESRRRLHDFMAQLIPQALAAATDEMLLAEVRRRGLDPQKGRSARPQR
jgi:hypothetical protein